MTSAMLLYLLTISVLLMLASLVTEWLLIRLKRPARWSWAVAMLLCIALPFLPARPSAAPAVSEAASVAPGPVASVETIVAAPAVSVPEFIVPRGWLLAASLAAGLLLCGGWVMLVYRSRRWPTDVMDGATVLRAPATGPAVIGFFLPEIVVPAWAFELPVEQRRMLLAHEQSHIDARDPLLLLGAALVVVAMPWNPLLWFALSRLRGTIEIDCDRRVLAGGEAVDSYARCLVDSVALAAAGPVPAVGALSLSSSHLERRVHLMLHPRRAFKVVSVVAALAGAGLVTSAFGVTPPAPSAPAETSWQAAKSAIDAQPYKSAERYYSRVLNGKVGSTEALYGVFYDNWSIRDPKAKGC